MPSSTSVVANALAATELAFARNASFTWLLDPVEYTYAPDTSGDPLAENDNTGVSVAKAVTAFVIASVPYKPNMRAAFCTIKRSGYDSTADYSITLNGSDTYTTTGLTNAAAVESLVAQINAAASVDTDPLARAVASATDNILDTVMVYAVGDPSTATAPVLTVQVATDHTDGALVAFPSYADADAFSIRLWAKYSTNPTGIPAGMELPWTVVNGGDVGAISPEQGFTEKFNVAAIEKFYVEVYDVVAHTGDGDKVLPRANVVIGVAIPEE